MRFFLTVLLVLGCASTPDEIVDLADATGVGDAGVDADAFSPDAGADAMIDQRWSAPARIDELSSLAAERFPAPTADGLEIYFARTEMIGAAFVNVAYAAARPTAADPFGAPFRPVAFGSLSIWEFELSTDQLEWYYWKGLGQLARSVRVGVDSPWSFPQEIGVDGFSPSLSGDSLALYYVGAAGDGVMMLERDSIDEDWRGPTAVDIGGAIDIVAIDVSSDELALLVTADPGGTRAGVYLATRPDLGAPFGPPERIEALRGGYREARFGPGDAEIYVSAELGGNVDLFRSSRASE